MRVPANKPCFVKCGLLSCEGLLCVSPPCFGQEAAADRGHSFIHIVPFVLIHIVPLCSFTSCPCAHSHCALCAHSHRAISLIHIAPFVLTGTSDIYSHCASVLAVSDIHSHRSSVLQGLQAFISCPLCSKGLQPSTNMYPSAHKGFDCPYTLCLCVRWSFRRAAHPTAINCIKEAAPMPI